MKNCWNEKIEFMSRDEMHALQSERLVSQVKRVYEKAPYYKAKMDKIGLLPEDIKSIDDLHLLPFTTKQDLRDHYPFGLFAAPMKDVIRIHASSGTTGKQTVVGYTAKDIEIWKECVARAFTMNGADSSSIVQVSYGYGLFTGGLGAHYGAEHIGAAVVPTSVGNTARQIQLMCDFGATVLCCTPSYATYLGETIRDMGIDKSQLRLKTGIFGAEPWTEPMRDRIEELLGIDAHDIYGLSEIMGPGVAIDCQEKNGLHVWEDHFVPEIINPDTGESLGADVNGELVFTTLTKEALPLLRYRTRDVSRISYKPCSCGRTAVKMAKPSGRTDDMLIIRGVNVFPSQIESVLMETDEVEPNYLLIVDREGTHDTMEIQIEVSPENFADNVRGLEALSKKISGKIQSTLGLAAKIHLVEPKTLQRSEGKAARVIDKRQLY